MSIGAVHDALVSAFATRINGAGDYTYDVTGTDQVVKYDQLNPDRLPAVSVQFLRIDEELGPELGDFQETGVFYIVGMVNTTQDHPKERAGAALSMLNDLRRAAREAFGAGDLDPVHTLLGFSATAIEGDDLESDEQYGVVFGEIRLVWFEDGC